MNMKLETEEEPPRFPGSDNLFHCSLCDVTLHQNDKETHLNGYKHKRKIPKDHNKDKEYNSQLKCDVCKTEFTDSEFYTAHLGSKTHKRNVLRLKKISPKGQLNAHNDDSDKEIVPETVTPSVSPLAFRIQGRRMPINGNDNSVNIDDLKEISDYKGSREKYRPRNLKTNEGHFRSYIYSVTAYWAISLAVDPTIKDFKISVNNKEWKEFGDVIVEIVFVGITGQENTFHTYVIQLKQTSNNVKNVDSVCEGRFDFARYIKQVSTFDVSEISGSVRFIVFTTAVTSSKFDRSFTVKPGVLNRLVSGDDNEMRSGPVEFKLKSISNRRKYPINTSDDNENIFLFAPDSALNLPRILFYTRQKKIKHFAKIIDEIISAKVEARDVEIHREFIKYIEEWAEGILGGNYKLKREDVLIKVGHILLSDFQIYPEVWSMDSTQNFGIWNQAVNSADITILERHSLIFFKVCEPLNIKIEKELSLRIDTTTKSINISQDDIKNIKNSVLKMYLFEETRSNINEDIPLDIIYVMFWKAGLIPMLLEAEDLKAQDFVLQVIHFLKSLNVTRRYFLKSPDANIRSSIRPYKSLTFFITLDDLKQFPQFLFEYIKIGITDSFTLSLKTIQETDMFFQKSISANEFFDMSLGKYNFKPLDHFLVSRETEDAKLILNDDLMNRLRDEIDARKGSTTTLRPGREWLRGINPDIF